MSEYFLIAKIDSVLGNGGFVKVSSFTDFPERFWNLEEVYIDFFGDKKKFIVEDVKLKNNVFYIKFNNFDNAEDVRVLLNKEIFVDEEHKVELPEDYYFIHDLIGSIVLRNGVEFGKIKDVLTLPANAVYVIEDTAGREILIPAVKDFIESFDPENKILVLKPGGDFYENED